MAKKILTVYGVAILLGILTGIIGSFFQMAIHGVDSILTNFYHYMHENGVSAFLLSAVVSAVMAFIAWLLVVSYAPEAAGSGIQEIEGVLLNKRKIYWRRLLPVKFIGGVLVISAKMVVGREGPTIQMGGNLGDMLGEIFRFKHERRKTLISAGAAAGLATAFNAPLAGVLFVIEEMRNEFNFNFINFKTVAICCIFAVITTQCLVGSAPAIPMAVFDAPDLNSLWLFFLFGIIAGIVGLFFNQFLMFTLRATDKISKRYRAVYVILIGALVGFLAIYYSELAGGGYQIIEQSLTMFPSFTTLVILIVIRFVLTMLCYSTGVPGGIFAPMLALGTLLGLGCYQMFSWVFDDMSVHPGMFAVAGMGSLFSAAIRAPITGIILVVEMTQNYSLILPLMVSCLTSTTIVQLARNAPIYTQLLHRTLKMASL
ncbi:H(+)/Cl(-) exchange transporter ClcA [Legionella dresdenensis]|uniref:H(+)/Cl(-) exchange transporter ClcA n=1 Tax=Legionella dresdenensis TaxID=450200 RepID=A0ABV8CCX0_9GAMM